MIRLLVCGSRSLQDSKDFIEKQLNNITKNTTIDYLISGMAKGVDIIAYDWAKSKLIEILEFYANWKPDGKLDRRAGIFRNIKMLEEGKPTHVICFMDCRDNPDGTTGSKHMIDIASKANIPVKIINVK